MQLLSSARQSEVKTWEEEITACGHTFTLQPLATGPLPASGTCSSILRHGDPLTSRAGLAHCLSCDLKDNLWLCLTCGSLGCGRARFGGTGGNGHGLEHYQETKHPVSVKLGTITPEGGGSESRDFITYLRR